MLPQVRATVKNRLHGRLCSVASPYLSADLVRPAVVFAPHPDDETLGCGGMILSRRRAGGRVRVVFMTDGSGSHRAYIDPTELKQVREREALAACERLGVAAEDVTFLGFPDGGLDAHVSQAADRVKGLVDSVEEIFVPYRLEGPADHRATRSAVLLASRGVSRPPAIFEYPVWFWNHWPWVPFRHRTPRARLGLLRRSLAANLALLRDFRCILDVSAGLDVKQAALLEHRSQTRRPAAHPDWPILADVAGGEFLGCFFSGHELFHRHRPGGEEGEGAP